MSVLEGSTLYFSRQVSKFKTTYRKIKMGYSIIFPDPLRYCCCQSQQNSGDIKKNKGDSVIILTFSTDCLFGAVFKCLSESLLGQTNKIKLAWVQSAGYRNKLFAWEAVTSNQWLQPTDTLMNAECRHPTLAKLNSESHPQTPPSPYVTT